eukprot:6366558-Prymnesium_polylepis.1
MRCHRRGVGRAWRARACEACSHAHRARDRHERAARASGGYAAAGAAAGQRYRRAGDARALSRLWLAGARARH